MSSRQALALAIEIRHRGNDRRLWGALVRAAQASYAHNPEYGLTDADMEAALRAGFAEFLKHPEKTKSS